MYRNRNRYAPPPTVTASRLVAVIATAIRYCLTGTRWISAAKAEEEGVLSTGRVIAQSAEGVTPSSEEREIVLSLCRRVSDAISPDRTGFDENLRDVACAVLNGDYVSMRGATSIAAYLPFWAAAQDAREAARPAPEAGFAAILSLFANAAARLKYPKIHFANLPGIGNLKIQRAASGKNAGGLNLTDGRPFGSNTFYGAITPTGEFRASRATTEALREFLAALAADPATVAGEYGRGSGNCCFCSKELTDDRSVTVGYGPICAGHYGLPWG